MQQAPPRSAVRENTHRPSARLHRARLEDPVLRGREEEGCAPAVEAIVEIDEEREARVDGGVRVVDVGRPRRLRLVQRRRRPGAVDLSAKIQRH